MPYDFVLLQKLRVCNYFWIEKDTLVNQVHCPKNSRLFFGQETGIVAEAGRNGLADLRIKMEGTLHYDCSIEWKGKGNSMELVTLPLPPRSHAYGNTVLKFKRKCDRSGPYFELTVLPVHSPEHSRLIQRSQRIGATMKLQRSTRTCGVFAS